MIAIDPIGAPIFYCENIVVVVVQFDMVSYIFPKIGLCRAQKY